MEKRKHYSATDKVKILREYLENKMSISALSEKRLIFCASGRSLLHSATTLIPDL